MTFDGYLERLPAEKSAALERLRKLVHATAPKVEEYIGYDLPGFRLEGKGLLWLGAAKKHCAIYGLGGGTIRFQPEKSPTALEFKRLIRARIAKLR
jgi:uncharacterized protein YdhG (YjbR/CyaY superfamily)